MTRKARERLICEGAGREGLPANIAWVPVGGPLQGRTVAMPACPVSLSSEEDVGGRNRLRKLELGVFRGGEEKCWN